VRSVVVSRRNGFSGLPAPLTLANYPQPTKEQYDNKEHQVRMMMHAQA
jgi:hypothetical protein